MRAISWMEEVLTILFNVMISDDGSTRIPLDDISWNKPTPVWVHPQK